LLKSEKHCINFIMTSVLHRTPKSPLRTAITGEGCFLIDQEGKRYFDGSSGAAVSCLGHQHPDIVAALIAQAQKLSYAHSSFFTTEPMEELADFLVKNSPEGLDHVYFVSGGSEAVEAALKLARQYFLEIGLPDKKHIIARKQSYHGNTLGALSAGGNLWRRIPFEPLLIETFHISACYPYRGQLEGETLYDYGQRVANELEAQILTLGPDTVAAFIAEPVVGATMGCVSAVPGYFKRIREICTQYNVLLILDEVMCGMGRTGTLFACEYDGISADLITVAKGLGAGYMPIGATMISKKIYNAILSGSGFFQHGHTYIGHALACATSLAVQKVIARDHLLAQVKDLGLYLGDALHATFDHHPFVGDIRGRGLFWGVEIVADRDTKAPFDPSLSIHAKIKKTAMDLGLMCYPMGGTIDGKNGDHVMLAPPYICTQDQLDFVVDTLSRSIDSVLPK